MKKLFRRRLALFLAVLFALPALVLAPAEAHAFADRAPNVPAEGAGEFVLGQTMVHALPHPIRQAGPSEAFAFNLGLDPGEHVYAIFPMGENQVVRLDFRRIPGTNELDFTFRRFNSVYNARRLLGNNALRFSVADLEPHPGLPNVAYLPLTYGTILYGLTPPLTDDEIAERIWMGLPRGPAGRLVSFVDTGVYELDASGNVLVINPQPPDPARVFYPRAFISPGAGFSFTADGQQTTFHVAWLPDGTAQFGIGSPDGVSGLLERNRIYTFEFGRPDSNGDAFGGAENRVLYFNHVTEFSFTGGNAITSRPFARDWLYDPASLIEFFPPDQGLDLSPQPNLTYQRPLQYRDWVRAPTPRVPGQLPRATNYTRPLIFMDDGVPPENFFIGWFREQRLSISVPTPLAWGEDIAGGNAGFNADIWDIHQAAQYLLPGHPDFDLTLGNRTAFRFSRFGVDIVFMLDQGRTVNMDAVRITPDPPPGMIEANVPVDGVLVPHIGIYVASGPQDLAFLPRDPMGTSSLPNRVHFATATDRIELVLNLRPDEYSTLFDGSTVDFRVNHSSVALPGHVAQTYARHPQATRVPDFTIFSFLGYEYPEYIGDSYRVRVIPYRRSTTGRTIGGTYQLYTHPDRRGLQQPPPALATDGFYRIWPEGAAGLVDLIISAQEFAGLRTFNRIFFRLADREPIETLPLALRPHPDHAIIGSPNAFVILDHTLTPYYRDEATNVITVSELEMDLQWNIASTATVISQLHRRFRNAEGGAPPGSLLVPGQHTEANPLAFPNHRITIEYTLRHQRQLEPGHPDFDPENPSNTEDIPFGIVTAILELYMWIDANGDEQSGVRLVLPDSVAASNAANAAAGHFDGPKYFQVTEMQPLGVSPDGQYRLTASVHTFASSWENPRGTLNPQRGNFIFAYPDVHPIHVHTSGAIPAFPYVNVGTDVRSLNDYLTLSDFAQPWVAPPQDLHMAENIYIDEQFAGIGQTLRAAVEFSFTAPYPNLTQFVREVASLHNVHGHTAVPTFTYFIGHNERQMLDFQRFMEQYSARPGPMTWPITGLPPITDGASPPNVLFPALPMPENVHIAWVVNSNKDTNHLIDAYSVGTSAAWPNGQPMTIREALREGFIVGIIDIPENEADRAARLEAEGGGEFPPIMVRYPAVFENYNIINLDINQRYYGAMLTMVSFHPPSAPVLPVPVPGDTSVLRFFSGLTGIEALTTDGEHMPVDPDEIAPARPLWFRPLPADWPEYQRNYITDVTARVFFDVRNEFIPQADGNAEYRVRYEVIRTRVPLDEARIHDAMNAVFIDGRVWNAPEWAAYYGIDLGDAGFQMFQWTSVGYGEDPYEWQGRIIRMEDFYPPVRYMVYDISLFPNTIYFYYVRAVSIRIDQYGQHMVNASVWDAISITTALVDAPRNLIVIREPGLVDDPMREVYIQFEVPYHTWQQGFSWQLEIRAGDDEWQRFDMGRLPGYRELIEDIDGELWAVIRHRVRGLSPNTGYTFRVRLLDNDGFPSLWSNEAFHRTDFDQDAYDLDRRTENWIEFIRRNLREEFDRDYWPLEHEHGRPVLKLYRYSRVGGIIRSTPASLLFIHTDDSAVNRRMDILLPLNLIEAASSGNMSLVLRDGRLETVIPPGAITNRIPGANDAAWLVDQSNQLPVDYYVMVSIQYTTLHSNPVDGNDLAEREARISASAMATVMNAGDLDARIEAMVFEAIEGEYIYTEARRTINSMLLQGLSNDEVALFAYGTIERIIIELMREARQMYVRESYRSFPITEFAVPIMHALLTENPAAAVAAFVAFTGGNFAPFTLSPYRMGMSVRLSGPATVLFTIFDVLTAIPGITENVVLPGEMAAVIARHGLQDFVGRTSGEVNSPITMNNAMNIVARLAGASSGADGTAFMREHGYIITGRTGSSSLTRQEAAYLVIALYELRSGFSANAMQIRNHALTSGISGIDNSYLQSVRVAFELGIITEPDWQPRDAITVMEFLDMLSRLNFRIAL